jgi:hypothetical protein
MISLPSIVSRLEPAAAALAGSGAAGTGLGRAGLAGGGGAQGRGSVRGRLRAPGSVVVLVREPDGSGRGRVARRASAGVRVREIGRRWGSHGEGAGERSTESRRASKRSARRPTDVSRGGGETASQRCGPPVTALPESGAAECSASPWPCQPREKFGRWTGPLVDRYSTELAWAFVPHRRSRAFTRRVL